MRGADFAKVSLGIVAGALAGGAAVVSAQGDTDAIRACVASGPSSPGTANLRVVDARETCDTGRETSLTWNRQGPQGLQGPVGADGIQGPAGPAAKPQAVRAQPARISVNPYADLGYIPKTGKTKVVKKSLTNASTVKHVEAKCPATFPHLTYPGGTFEAENVSAIVDNGSFDYPGFTLLFNGKHPTADNAWAVTAGYQTVNNPDFPGHTKPTWRLTAVAFCKK